MKTKVEVSDNGWISVQLEAETVQEAGSLVKFGMNADANARKVLHVYAEGQGVSAHIALNYRSDRKFGRKHHAVSRVRVVDNA